MAYDKNFINAIFTDRSYIAAMTSEEKKQNFFIMCRNIAKQYPEDMQMFNKTKINMADVVDIMSEKLYNGKYVPKWIYTKSTGAERTSKSNNGFKKPVLEEYCRRYGYSMKDIEGAIKMFGDEFYKEMADFEKFLKDISQTD